MNDKSTPDLIPLAGSPVCAGFPSPADDYIEQSLDLNEHLIQHPAATFFVKAMGNSMIDAGIHSGDILIVDRALSPVHNKIVVAILNGEFTVKRLCQQNSKIRLVAENPDYPTILVSSDMDFQIWGVVTFIIHRV